MPCVGSQRSSCYSRVGPGSERSTVHIPAWVDGSLVDISGEWPPGKLVAWCPAVATRTSGTSPTSTVAVTWSSMSPGEDCNHEGGVLLIQIASGSVLEDLRLFRQPDSPCDHVVLQYRREVGVAISTDVGGCPDNEHNAQRIDCPELR